MRIATIKQKCDEVRKLWTDVKKAHDLKNLSAIIDSIERLEEEIFNLQ